MAIVLNYVNARRLLNRSLSQAEGITGNEPNNLPDPVVEAIVILFASKTQSYREVILGCSVVRYLNKEADLQLPYTNLGDYAYNGRSLDEQIINPFLHDNEIP